MATEYRLPFTAKEIEEKLNKVGQPVSWDELNDRPFGEEVEILGDTITWDGTPSDCFIAEQGMEMHRVSENTPSKAELIGGTIALQIGTESTSDEMTEDNVFQETDDIVVCSSGIPFMLVVYKDNASITFEGVNITFPQKGIYFLYAEDIDGIDGYNLFTSSLTINGYNFTKTTVTPIDPKFLPEGGFGYGHFLGDTLTWDGTIGDRHTITTTIDMGADFGGEAELLYCHISDNTPSKELLLQGCITDGNSSYDLLDLTVVEEADICGFFYSFIPMLFVCYKDSTFDGQDVKKGIYFVCSEDTPDDFSISIKIPNYDFIEGEIHKIDPKFLPEGIGYEKQTTITSKTLIYDGQPTDVCVVLEGIRFYHISDSTPEASDLIGGVFGAGGQTMQIEEGMIDNIDECILGVSDFMLVCSEDNYTLDGVTFTKKGIYAISMIGEIPYPVSLTCQNYQFTQTINKIHHIDNKYIKEGLFERSTPNQILLDTVITAAESSSDVNMIDDESALSVFDSLRNDRVYSIVWNGVEYNCSKLQAGGMSIMGNMGLLGSDSFANTGEPFLYLTFDASVLYTVDAGDISIKIIGDAIQYAELPRETLVNATPLVLSEGDFANPSDVRSQITEAHTALQNHRRVYCMYNGKLVEMIAMYHHSWDMSNYSAFSLSTLDRNIIYDYNCYFSNGHIYTDTNCKYTTRTTSIQQKTITSSTANGTVGEMCYDSDYMYVCVAENTWKRFALETW